MKVEETKLDGVLLVTFDVHADVRGSYSRLFGKEEFESLGLDAGLNNIGVSYNKLMGTVRGMHYQAKPFEEAKLVQCRKGSIYDVVLDLRKDSPTFGQSEAFELSAGDSRAVYISKGFAHGFQTLEDESEVMYFISEKYDPASSRGVRWNDTRFGIEFPLEVSVINERDANYPDFEQ